MPSSGTEPSRVDDIRRASYRTGEAIAVLLDRFAPGWAAELEAGDLEVEDLEAGAAAYPDQLLHQALAHQEAAEFAPAERAAILDRARNDVAALRAERHFQREEFLSRPGRVVVTVTGDELLRMVGFDPMNLRHLGGGEVLHTHFLKIRGPGVELELFDTQALTESSGTHPLLDGVSRVTFTSTAISN